MPTAELIPETAFLALCSDLPTALEVQRLYDTEAGYPIVQLTTLAGTPVPPGASNVTEHASDLEPVQVDPKEHKILSWAYPLPAKPLPVALAAKVQAKTRAEVDALKPTAVVEAIEVP